MKQKFLTCLTILVIVTSIFTTKVFAMSNQKNNAVLFIYNEKVGLLDSDLNILIEPIYENGNYISNDEYVILKKNKSSLTSEFLITNRYGKIIFSEETIFNGVENISDKQILFKSTNKPNVINNFIFIPSENKKIVLSEKLLNVYSVLFTFEKSDYIAAGNFYYDIKSQKKILTDKNFIHVMPMIDGVAIVVDKGFKKKLIDKNGNIIYEDIINSARNFTEGLLPIKCKDKSGFIDKTGKFIFECPIYPDGKDSPKGIPNLNCCFSEDLAYVPVEKDSWILFDKQGNVIKDDLDYYPSGNIYSEGMLQVYDKEKNKYGFLNSKGDIEIPCVLDKATSFKNGYSQIVYNQKEGLLDLNGNLYFSSDILENIKTPFCNLINGK